MRGEKNLINNCQNQKSTYLIPAVRATLGNNKLGSYRRSNGECWSGVYGVWLNGVNDLKSWKDSKGLGEKEQKELKAKLKDGFVIGRGGKGYGGSGGNWGKGRSSDITSFVKKLGGRRQGEVVIYKNAGILVGKSRRGEACEKNNKKVRYFPLDIK